MAIRTVDRLRPLRAALLATSCLVLLAVPPAAAKVGVTSAADGDPLGKPPNETERVLRIGIDVQANELITTSAADRAHLVFLDGSSLTVGPNARLTIDKFVFDPNTRTGELAINATKGVLRLVGGKISKTSPVTVTTPSSTIGIRGGIALITVSEVRTVSDFIFGTSMTVSSGGTTQTATRAGSQIVTNLGSVPASPTLLKQGSLNAALGQLEGTSSGGGNVNPDLAAQRSGLPGTNSQQPPTLPPGATPNRTGTPNPNNNTLVNALNNNNIGVQPEDSRPVQPVTDNVTTGPTRVVVTRGAYKREQPFLAGTFNPNTQTASIDPQNSIRNQPTGTVQNQLVTIRLESGDTVQVPWTPGQASTFTAQTPYGPATGVGFVHSSEQFFAFTLTESSGRRVALFGGTPTTASGFPTGAVGAHQLANLVNPGNLPFTPTAVGGDSQLKSAATVAPLYTVYGTTPGGSKSLQVTLSVAGAGSAQKSYMGVLVADYGVDSSGNLSSTGNFVGSYRLGGDRDAGRLSSGMATADIASGGTAIYGDNGQFMAYTPDRIVSSHGAPSRVTGAALDQSLDGASRPYYPVTIATPATSEQVPSGVGSRRTEQTLSGYVGGLIDTYSGGSRTTIVPLALAAQPSDVRISTSPSSNQATGTLLLRGYAGNLAAVLALELGGAAGSNGPTSAFIDDKRYAMTHSATRSSRLYVGESSFDVAASTVLASSKSAEITLPHMGSCACEYLSWGWWSTNVNVDLGEGTSTGRSNLGTYVSGKLTTAVQMPQTGSATYNGLMVGNVNNAGNSYVAGGTYKMDWDFARRAGVSNMTFDGQRYTGTANAYSGTGGTTFNGSMVGGGRTGAYNGSFFAAPGDAAKYQGGTFSIGTNGSPYKASGIFAGQRGGMP